MHHHPPPQSTLPPRAALVRPAITGFRDSVIRARHVRPLPLPLRAVPLLWRPAPRAAVPWCPPGRT